MVALLKIGKNTAFEGCYQEVVNGSFHDELIRFIERREKFAFSVLLMQNVEKPITRSNSVFESSAGGNYMLFHKKTNSVYFGETNNLAARACEHLTAIHCKSHSNSRIRRISKQGTVSDWVFSVIYYEQSEANRKAFERKLIGRKWNWNVLNVK